MKNERNNNRRKTAIILGGALLAAAWMIVGPGILLKWGVGSKFIEALVWGPAMIVFFASIACDKQTLACEARAFKRLIGR